MEGDKEIVLCSLLLLVFSVTEIFPSHAYTNIWAVKIRGSLQKAKELAVKHGFIYDKHVSCFLRCVFHFSR